MEKFEGFCPDNPEKLQALLDIEGFETLEQYLELGVSNGGPLDSVVPGICFNEDCDYVCDCEPDSQSGYCESCGTTTVHAITSILGLA